MGEVFNCFLTSGLARDDGDALVVLFLLVSSASSSARYCDCLPLFSCRSRVFRESFEFTRVCQVSSVVRSCNVCLSFSSRLQLYVSTIIIRTFSLDRKFHVLVVQ